MTINYSCNHRHHNTIPLVVVKVAVVDSLAVNDVCGEAPPVRYIVSDAGWCRVRPYETGVTKGWIMRSPVSRPPTSRREGCGISMRLIREPPPFPGIDQKPSYPWLVVGAVCIGAFMGQLDASIAQLVLPTLETAFHAWLILVDWVTVAYLLILAKCFQ